MRHLEEKHQESLLKALKNTEVNAWDIQDLKQAYLPAVSFNLKEEINVNYRDQRMAPRHNAVVKKELDELLQEGTITPKSSDCSFPVVIATRKDGTLRFCAEKSELKIVMMPDRWPFSKIEKLFDDPSGAKVFTTLVLYKGYWKVHISEEWNEMATLVCSHRTCKFKVMPSGLMSAS